MLNWIEKKTDCTTYFEAEVKGGTITIEPRPSYCDRGRWLAKIHTGATHIDDADRWPRYYFSIYTALFEVEAFAKCRNIILENLKDKTSEQCRSPKTLQ